MNLLNSHRLCKPRATPATADDRPAVIIPVRYCDICTGTSWSGCGVTPGGVSLCCKVRHHMPGYRRLTDVGPFARYTKDAPPDRMVLILAAYLDALARMFVRRLGVIRGRTQRRRRRVGVSG